ncbi:glycogen debranching N-terminal domain-containing protein [Georgenia sp. M64]|uniref:amylo-alpha-1,6-glucosidase n=1 Tax=Georgenia sp. M64 TaxID=3120520 RepID=UPI0030E5DC22
MTLQPLLHDLLVATMAPAQAWSAPDGQVRPAGAQGFYEGDVRVLSRAEVMVAGAEPETISAGPAGPGAVEVIALLRAVDGPGADPTVRLRRRREVSPGQVVEHLEVASATAAAVRVPLTVTLGADLAQMDRIKAGESPAPLPAVTDGKSVSWSAEGTDVVVRADGAKVDLSDPAAPRLLWVLDVPPGANRSVTWAVTTTQPDSPMLPGPGVATWSTPTVRCDDRRLSALIARGLEDLETLRMRARFAPDDVFVAAGAPWFFTLFGRDSLWAARMMLPLGTELAAGTLRALAARQGTVVDPETAEQPGKILHEVRGAELDLGGGSVLPPVYYGTIDATPLWVCLLHDAWRWGMPTDEVEALLPNLEAALAWIADHGDSDGDGFLEYLDQTGRGLANQGWKDSGDSVQWRDGTLARGPIALCEVQAYAHEAAVSGAALLEAFGRPGPDRWRGWAEAMRRRFRGAFWVDDDHGGYPAIALDADKRPVDTLTSNIGHLLGTGLLTKEDEVQVARRLTDLDSGYGLRTMATTSAGYWPLRYHGGSVWTHDTAIAVAGLVRAGHPDVAASLAEGLLAASADAGSRLPELYSGDARGTVPAMVPYPAACRPQAWSAASAVVLLGAFLGLEPDVPAGRLGVRPVVPAPFGALEVRGLQVAGRELTVAVDAGGHVVTAETLAPVRVEPGSPSGPDPRAGLGGS